MSLINCSACSKPVSSRAIKCPNCGEPTIFHDSSGPRFDPFSTGENYIPEILKGSFTLFVLGFIVLVYAEPGSSAFGISGRFWGFLFTQLGIIGMLTCLFMAVTGIGMRHD